MRSHRYYWAQRTATAVLLLLLSGASGAAAQRIAPARFARIEKPARHAVAIARLAQPGGRHFSVLACVLWGTAGGAAGAVLGWHILPVGGGEDPQVAGLLIGGTIGFGAGISWYTLVH